MSTNQIRTAAFCKGCGHVSYYSISFDIISDEDMSTKADLRTDAVISFCEKCKLPMINCDLLIAQQLSDLNQLGYRTLNSCEGHWRKVLHRAVNQETGEASIVDDYVLLIPYVAFMKTLPLGSLRKLYTTALDVQNDNPQWKIQPKLQIVCRDEQSHRRRAHTIVPESDDFWERPPADMGLWIGAVQPKEFTDLKPGERIDYDVGQTIALELTQDFNQFLTELVSRLKK